MPEIWGDPKSDIWGRVSLPALLPPGGGVACKLSQRRPQHTHTQPTNQNYSLCLSFGENTRLAKNKFRTGRRKFARHCLALSSV